MKYTKYTSFGGKWAQGSQITPGTKAYLTTEVQRVESQFKDARTGAPKMQDVAKIRFQGHPEDLNLSVNRASLNALVDAFGEDSKDWVKKPLIAEPEKTKVAGKSVFPIYLVPDGYERVDDDNGYTVIVKKGTSPATIPEDEVKAEDLPF